MPPVNAGPAPANLSACTCGRGSGVIRKFNEKSGSTSAAKQHASKGTATTSAYSWGRTSPFATNYLQPDQIPPRLYLRRKSIWALYGYYPGSCAHLNKMSAGKCPNAPTKRFTAGTCCNAYFETFFFNSGLRSNSISTGRLYVALNSGNWLFRSCRTKLSGM